MLEKNIKLRNSRFSHGLQGLIIKLVSDVLPKHVKLDF
jgi:hypothetical protein